MCSREIKGCHPYCQKCFELIKNNNVYFKIIKNDWKLEAKQEDAKYFYFVNEAEEILAGKKSMVIGRKGEGKTALAQYI